MSVPITANYRINIKYTIAGFVHSVKMFCDVNDDTVADPTLVSRDGLTTPAWDTAAQDTWDEMRNLFQDTSTGGVTADLEKRVVTGPTFIWQAIKFATLTGGGASSAAYKQAHQITYTLRDTSFNKVKHILLEDVQNYIGHSSTGYGLGTAQDNYTKVLDGTTSGVGLPFNWMKSRGNHFLASAGLVAGLTFDLNDRIKRRRGLE